MRKAWRYGEIEILAWRRLQEYGARIAPLVGPAVPLDLLIEKLFGLSFSWEEIPEDGHTIYAGLRPGSKEIVLNEKWLDLFHRNPGFERFTKGHELGHWELHVDHGLPRQGRLFEALPESMFWRKETAKGSIWILRGESPEDIQGPSAEDTPQARREVNRYAAALLMPRQWIVEALRESRVLTRRTISEMADRFEVGISAMRVRLGELRVAYIADDGTVYRTPAEAGGQLQLLP